MFLGKNFFVPEKKVVSLKKNFFFFFLKRTHIWHFNSCFLVFSYHHWECIFAHPSLRIFKWCELMNPAVIFFFFFKGHLIWKCPFGVFNSTKKPTKIFCRSVEVLRGQQIKLTYSSVPNRRACTFISGKVCLLTSIEDKRQTLPEISMHIQNNAAIGILL